MAISIYSDREVLEIIEKIKENNPDFNMSAFVKEALIKYGGSKHLSEADIIRNKKEIEIKIEGMKNELEYWDNKMVELKTMKELIKQEKEEKEKEKELLIEKEKFIKKNIQDTFKEEMGRKMTEDEFIDYWENKGEYGNIWSYVDLLKEDESK